jgi:O-antigen ligase
VLFISIFVGSKLYFKRVGDWVRFLTIIAIIFYFTNIITSIGLGYNALDRLIQPDQSDYLTIKDRFYYWNLAVEMGLSKPLFGVGLGNFFDYIPGNKNVNLSLFDYQNNFFKITWVHPHNLFFGVIAETGFVGLLALLTMLLFFTYEDYRAVKKHKDRTLNLLVVSFWFVFLFSLINAPISLAYLGLFWVLRGLITACTTNKIIS